MPVGSPMIRLITTLLSRKTLNGLLISEQIRIENISRFVRFKT